MLKILIVLGVLLIPFGLSDFTAHGCKFIYMGGDGSPLPIQGLLSGYAIEIGSGMTVSGTMDTSDGEVTVECNYE